MKQLLGEKNARDFKRNSHLSDGSNGAHLCKRQPAVATYSSFDQIVEGTEARYPALTRISDPGTNSSQAYTGFFFYQALQFDATGRYALGMKVNFEEREVELGDRAEIVYVDLKKGYQWTKIGESTAWNWQQGCRLQWRPRSDEIIWNDRSGDVKNRYTYDPFGEEFATECTETTENPFKFTGQLYDSEIGQYYLRARQYDPHISRFTAGDPG